jgi:hypothetical protein
MREVGEIGTIGTVALVPEVVDAVRIPVIAAGGMADGRGLVGALALVQNQLTLLAMVSRLFPPLIKGGQGGFTGKARHAQ